jgi:hypothetical protein
MLSKKQKDEKMNLTIEINGTFKKVEALNERGTTLLNNFIDGVVEAKELENNQYKSYLQITSLATIL